MNYKRVNIEVLFILLLITNIFIWVDDSTTLGNRLSALFFFLISAFFLGLKVYKWFQEED